MIFFFQTQSGCNRKVEPILGSVVVKTVPIRKAREASSPKTGLYRLNCRGVVDGWRITRQLVDSNARLNFFGIREEFKRVRYLFKYIKIEDKNIVLLLFQILQYIIKTFSFWWINRSFQFFFLIGIYLFQEIVNNPLIYMNI
jgi:hypothetical protein